MLLVETGVWHAISVPIILLIGAWIALAQKKLFLIGHRRALFYYLWHTLFCFLYYLFSFDSVVDATGYYISSANDSISFYLGTQSIKLLVSFFANNLGISYLGCFLIFNIIGYIGMLAFAASLNEITRSAGPLVRRLALLILLLPSLSFWSSAIGKDALTFMASGILAWAALKINRRALAFPIAFFLYLIARPHIAGFLLFALSMSIFSSYASLAKKILLSMFFIPLTFITMQAGLQFVGLGESMSLSSVYEYIQTRQALNLDGGSSINIATMPLHSQLFSFLFRPLFFDAHNVLSFFASLDNVILLIIFVFSGSYLLMGAKSALPSFAFWFYLYFVVPATLALSVTTANLGISVRQKWMILPMLIIFSFSVLRRRSLTE